MTKDERVSMFNQAQARDMEEKEKVVKDQRRGRKPREDAEDGKMFTVRVPAVLHAAMMQERLMTGRSMNTIIVEALTERYPDDCPAMQMAKMSLEMNSGE